MYVYIMRRSQVYHWKSSFVIPLFKDGDPESATTEALHWEAVLPKCGQGF